MQFRYKYYGSTSVEDSATAQAFHLAPDTLRPPTAFDGALRRDSHAHLAFREAMSALHQVVVSDQRYRGRDKSAYRQWLAENEQSLLAGFMADKGDLELKTRTVQAELSQLRQRKIAALAPFYKARQRYFNWLYTSNRDAWFVLDPVITVHPDRLLFEAFSQDESTYCAVSVRHDVFDRTGEMAYGTTNIDYSASLYDEFQKIRDYKATRLQIDPAGFTVATGDDPAFREEKIDLPDSWVRGFLQVSSAMTLPATVVELHPMDLHNLCAALRQRKERAGPRSLRFELSPGGPARLVLEPWNLALTARRSAIVGAPLTAPRSIRVWGRRRLLTLERLIAMATRVRVHLLGTGMPSFWVVELGDITVTLGLSGWSANDWADAGRFDLLQPRHDVSDATKQAVGAALQGRWMATSADLAAGTQLPRPDVEAALGLWVQAGRAVFDLPSGQFAWRELARDPLPIDTLRFASPEEQAALTLIHDRRAKLQSLQPEGQRLVVEGTVQDRSQRLTPRLILNADQQLVDAQCGCNFYRQNRLRRGPCSHMLALRQLAQPRLAEWMPQPSASDASPTAAGATPGTTPEAA
ncbi:SWIM zinc finger family protein [Roseateles amylovorans]|uniref:SWIM zinc finger family protein n=1 Tax=Roseateles amylovorans TaxID=2978473 RepID=A0ABY6B315_9BURK|nr:SWIM zinc finger family protein [Roseateles amylovorans]UXH79570.1 SWIM zinc finger family protein [Roseateles amylovorans]